MNKKLAKISAEIRKARDKRAELDQRIEELEKKYTEEENTAIVEEVRSLNLTFDQLAELLKNYKGKVPGSISVPGEKEAEHEEEI